MYSKELKHFGVLGMHWGRRKSKTNVSTPKKKMHINTKKEIDGKDLADDILKSMGTLVVANLAGSALVSAGKAEVGVMIGLIGGAYATGKTIGGVVKRIERR